jgi:hypothetical protein
LDSPIIRSTCSEIFSQNFSGRVRGARSLEGASPRRAHPAPVAGNSHPGGVGAQPTLVSRRLAFPSKCRAAAHIRHAVQASGARKSQCDK